MTEILNISYGNKFAIDADFDLNQLRKLQPVEEVKGNYIPKTDGSCMSVEFHKTLLVEPDKIQDNILAKAEEDRDNYRRWWNSESEKAKKAQAEVDCLKSQINEMNSVPPLEKL